MSYISSNNNRWYCQLETAYGQVPGISASNRIPAVSLSVQQKLEAPRRKDKTGTRTFAGSPAGMRKQTMFDATTYMTAWTNAGAAPPYSPLFQAALGSAPLFFGGGTAAAGSTAIETVFSASPGLVTGQAVTFAGEIRFVIAQPAQNSILLNAPFSSAPMAGSAIGQTVTYLPSTELPSVSLFDYWTPSTSAQRLLCGCAVDQLSLDFNGDYQEFAFNGFAQDVIDTTSFSAGQGQLPAYPIEPAVSSGSPTIVPGHLGEAWLGQTASHFYTLISAKVTLKNDLAMRTQEFGSILPMSINPGSRSVLMDLELYAQDDAATLGLYQAARQRAPIAAGFQIGQTGGQLLGVYMKSVVPEVPQYNDKDRRLQWQFRGSQAQGQGDDELVIAFG